jgi:hypothetical protein
MREDNLFAVRQKFFRFHGDSLRAAPMGMCLFPVHIHWEASKGTIIRGCQPQAIAPVNGKRRKTFASWLTPCRGWYGRLDRMALAVHLMINTALTGGQQLVEG